MRPAPNEAAVNRKAGGTAAYMYRRAINMERGELYAQIVRTLYAHGTNCELYAHFVRAPFYVTQVASVRRPHPQTTIGEFCFCAQLMLYSLDFNK